MKHSVEYERYLRRKRWEYERYLGSKRWEYLHRDNSWNITEVGNDDDIERRTDYEDSKRTNNI